MCVCMSMCVCVCVCLCMCVMEGMGGCIHVHGQNDFQM